MASDQSSWPEEHPTPIPWPYGSMLGLLREALPRLTEFILIRQPGMADTGADSV